MTIYKKQMVILYYTYFPNDQNNFSCGGVAPPSLI